MGILSFQIPLVSLETKDEISVLMYPGDTEFARAKPTHSTAIDLPTTLKLAPRKDFVRVFLFTESTTYTCG